MKKNSQDLINQEGGNLFSARIFAVQMIYSYAILAKRQDASFEARQYLSYYKGTKSIDAVTEQTSVDFYQQVIDNFSDIDSVILSNLAAGWSLERLPKVILSILRVATCEMLYFSFQKKAMLINDYLQITKILNHPHEVPFINGVLDKITPLPSIL